ncbi:MAG: histidinol dehydrogenase, partial [Bacteroidota bacterium]
MKIFTNPNSQTWASILARPTLDVKNLNDVVSEILQKVKKEGDKALSFYNKKFDGVALETVEVLDEEFEQAAQSLDNSLKKAIQTAFQNIQKFHAAQKTETLEVETMPGVKCWQKSMPIDKVGLYIPGGTAPLFSTILMLGIPAKVAGCKEIVMCTPPQQDGSVHPAMLYTAKLIGIEKVFKVGGVQAVAAMTFGTETIPKVYKIFGPGNQYVTCAKQLATQQGVAIDMPAGPSEVLVVADESCEPNFVAADLLSQAEHGVDSQVVLVTFSEETAEAILTAGEQQLKELPRREIAGVALENSPVIIFDQKATAVQLINEYAPEHLIIATKDADEMATQITNAGSVFIGNYTPESVGDYASGTNHTLPTNGFAKNYSGVNLDAFCKKITYQKLTEE